MLRALQSFFFGDRPDADLDPLFALIVEGARMPGFYGAKGVTDSVDGRFDLLVLHTFLLLDRLANDEDVLRTTALRQKLVDRLVAELDRSMREMGISDLRVGKKVIRATEAAYGRFSVYDRVFRQETNAKQDQVSGSDVDPLEFALARNVFRSEGVLADDRTKKLASWVRDVRDQLKVHSLSYLRNHQFSWPQPPFP